MIRRRAPLVALIAALVTALFVVPRPHTPKDVPYPPVDYDRTRAEWTEITERAQAAMATGLHVDIRGIGERVRRVSRLEVAGESEPYASERARLRALTHELLRQKREHELLQLRDVQAVLFVSALEAHWQNPTTETATAIQELGANVLSYLGAKERGWSRNRELLQPTLIALFNVRWAELLAVPEHLLFAPTANAHRLIQRFLVTYQLERGAKRDHQQLLTLLAAVPKYSPQYPAEYARGIVLYQMGRLPKPCRLSSDT